MNYRNINDSMENNAFVWDENLSISHLSVKMVEMKLVMWFIISATYTQKQKINNSNNNNNNKFKINTYAPIKGFDLIFIRPNSYP